jgi:hypothetical protein
MSRIAAATGMATSAPTTPTRLCEPLVRASDPLGYGFRFCHRVLEVATRLCEPLVVPFLCVVSSGIL